MAAVGQTSKQAWQATPSHGAAPMIGSPLASSGRSGQTAGDVATPAVNSESKGFLMGYRSLPL